MQIALGLHVIVHTVQVVIELRAMQDIQFTKTRYQSGLLDVVHLIAELAAFEDLAAFKANFGDAYARPLVDFEGYGNRSSRDLLAIYIDRCVGMSLFRQPFFQDACGIAELDLIFGSFLANSDAPLTKRLEHIGFRNALQSLK